VRRTRSTPSWARQLAALRLLPVAWMAAAAGRLALLLTALAVSSTIPTLASVARLRASGATAATVHAVTTGPATARPAAAGAAPADVDFAAFDLAASPWVVGLDCR
jgi:hypothetical protein